MGVLEYNPDLLPTGAPPPAADVPPANAYSPTTDMDAALNHFQKNAGAWQSVLKELDIAADDMLKIVAAIFGYLSKLFLVFIQDEAAIVGDYEKAVAGLMGQALDIAMPSATDLSGVITGKLGQYLTGDPTSGPGQAPGGITQAALALQGSVINRLGLFVNPVNPAEKDAGIRNAQYLLQQAAQLNLTTWAIEHLSHLIGLGWLKHFASFEQVIFQSVNPANLVRMMMDAMYTQLVRLPLTRDLNRRFPVKDLGIAAYARLFTRGAITSQQYLDKLLDAGLDGTQAQELLIETSKTVSIGDVGLLVTHKYWTQQDALTYLRQQGYAPPYDEITLWLETHREVFSRQRTLGASIIKQYNQGKIDWASAESLLRQVDFSDDEIAVISLESTVNGLVSRPSLLTYGQVKDLYTASLVDLDFVQTWLTNYTREVHAGIYQTYTPEEVQDLLLLDFTQAADRAAQKAVMAARERLLAQEAEEKAVKDQAANEAALADAEKAYAAALRQNASLLGTPVG